MGGMSGIWLPLVYVLPQPVSAMPVLQGRNSLLQISSNWLENCHCKSRCLAFSLTCEN